MSPKIIFTHEFKKDVQRLTPLSEKIQKTLELFLANQKHPSLHTKKLKPKSENLWSFRINKKYRIIFTTREKSIVLLYISKHYE